MKQESFVFQDIWDRVYSVRWLDGEPWLLMWNKHAKCFMTLRPAQEHEIERWSWEALPEKQAKLYK